MSPQISFLAKPLPRRLTPAAGSLLARPTGGARYSRGGKFVSTALAWCLETKLAEGRLRSGAAQVFDETRAAAGRTGDGGGGRIGDRRMRARRKHVHDAHLGLHER